ncbi:hypothetical protein HDF24_21925 [Mucilaginibacter sp. X4EP1]|uniref:hypothetical protein n=1 Tax=Mucilaginibacter sp. X4EP1 TaxID=2723092 RepID=UPI00216A4E8C|nr:hypothetical protein [Mucilaginibacter sp. X4EP1]MCS3812354.1 hypothetical protein [Mucilaginibacter sp. X4EP1]
MRASHLSTFLEIATRAYADHDRLKDELTAERSQIDPKFWGHFMQQDELDHIYTQVIVFLAMYMEAYIWDTGATYLGEKTMERLDKLSPQDKWEVVPQLLLNAPFPIKAHQQGYLKSLFQERNRLVHHKSIDMRPYIGKQIAVKGIPKDLIDFWERIDLGHYFEIVRVLPKSLEAGIRNKYSH